MNNFASQTAVTGRKPHRCAFCRHAIPAGVQHIKLVGRWDGDFYAKRGHADCEKLWNRVFDNWGDPQDGMDFDLCEVFCDSGEKKGAQDELDAWRGFLPHAVNRVEFRLRDWLEALE